MRRIFISYSHDSDTHRKRVCEFAKRLQADLGTLDFTVALDQLAPDPNEGWPKWCETQLSCADNVLVVITATYRRCYDGSERLGHRLGATFEAAIIRQQIYKDGICNAKFRFVFFEPLDRNYIPERLEGNTAFDVNDSDSYNQLTSWLRGAAPLAEPQSGQPAKVAWPTLVSDFPPDLANRKTEFAEFKLMIMGRTSNRILLLRGDSSSGKTALLREFAAYARHLKLPLAHLDFKGCPSLDDTLGYVALGLGSRLLRRANAAAGPVLRREFLADLQAVSEPVVALFDTYEQAPAEARGWFEGQLFQQLHQAPGLIVVVGGKEVPDQNRHAWGGMAHTIHLPPIVDPHDWLAFTQRKWPCPHLNVDHVQVLTMAARGNPGQISALLEALVQQMQRISIV